MESYSLFAIYLICYFTGVFMALQLWARCENALKVETRTELRGAVDHLYRKR
jgi:predicted secreted protein